MDFLKVYAITISDEYGNEWSYFKDDLDQPETNTVTIYFKADGTIQMEVDP